MEISTLEMVLYIFLFVCFTASVLVYRKVDHPYNGIFVIITFVVLVATVGDYNISTPAVSVEQHIETLMVNQNQLKEVTVETIELIELVSKMPEPTMIWGDSLDQVREDFENRIRIQKQKMKEITEVR